MKSVGEGGVRVNPESLRLNEMRSTEGGKIWEEKCIRERLQKMPGDCWKNSLSRKHSELELQTNMEIVCTDVTTKVNFG